MLTSAHIRNFRCFRDISVTNLKRINLFSGMNNCGKTSLLEALFLLSRGHSQNLMNSSVVRNVALDGDRPSVITKTLWEPLFHNLDISNDISLSASHSSLGSIELAISDGGLRTILPSQGKAAHSVPNNELFSRKLNLTLRINSKTIRESIIHESGRIIDAHSSSIESPFPAVKIDENVNIEEDAERLENIRLKEHTDPVIQVLRAIEPRLNALETNIASGRPMIWGNTRLKGLIPLSVMGEGVARGARLVMALASCKNGIVLVDGIENGFHYSVRPGLWNMISESSKINNVQVFATTHSYGCIMACLNAVGAAEFGYYRLENSNPGNKCISYEPEELSAAVEYGFEVR